ncbi:thioredoxin-like protein [Dysgonomonas alginatilytica]|uniref:Thioredoxin-like protein n=1 Tax=Dysgonomonas alginatilytica TaxID=1605892 RepID=A0A2V3PL01_9BACT|nr:DUF5106 domain-containing protein [Dysgonomonas alginatilytica]PXV60106.1 thioredoxin-like protein [Dysgonomonas alginatilytica]
MRHNVNLPSVLVWIIYPVAFTLFVIFCFMTCNSKPLGSNQTKTPVQKSTPSFVMISIPDSLKQPKDRAEYLVIHYWDNFNFSDTSYTHLPEVTEQAFANYIEILPHTQKETAESSIKVLLGKAKEEQTGTMYPYFCDLFKKYLYEPNSPLRNDEFYIPVVRYIIEDRTSDEAKKERAKFQLAMMLKNRIGEQAADFSYTLASGKTGTLHQLNSDNTLLLFYNPDCHACEETIAGIKASPVLDELIQSKTLTVLSFYPDADITIWKKHLSDIPTNWINGYDKELAVQNKRLYDLKAIPSLYLLDSDKKVILKDTELARIEEYLKTKNK